MCNKNPRKICSRSEVYTYTYTTAQAYLAYFYDLFRCTTLPWPELLPLLAAAHRRARPDSAPFPRNTSAVAVWPGRRNPSTRHVHTQIISWQIAT